MAADSRCGEKNWKTTHWIHKESVSLLASQEFSLFSGQINLVLSLCLPFHTLPQHISKASPGTHTELHEYLCEMQTSTKKCDHYFLSRSLGQQQFLLTFTVMYFQCKHQNWFVHKWPTGDFILEHQSRAIKGQVPNPDTGTHSRNGSWTLLYLVWKCRLNTT